jgi:hypothetical protein
MLNRRMFGALLGAIGFAGSQVANGAIDPLISHTDRGVILYEIESVKAMLTGHLAGLRVATVRVVAARDSVLIGDSVQVVDVAGCLFDWEGCVGCSGTAFDAYIDRGGLRRVWLASSVSLTNVEIERQDGRWKEIVVRSGGETMETLQ